MNSDNDTTLQSYNDHIQDYAAGIPQTVSGDVKAWIDRVLATIPKGSIILELGSGSGRDASYMESQGYKVIRTDAAQGFVDLLHGQGHDTQLLNAISDDFGSELDMVFANAVLLHFTPDQVKDILKRSYQSLQLGGILAFSVKKGNGEQWETVKLQTPRYFYLWRNNELQQLVVKAGFKIVDSTEYSNPKSTWLHVIAKK